MITHAKTPSERFGDHNSEFELLYPREPRRLSATKTVLLVEHRDEVVARLTADFQDFGLTVCRASSGWMAAKCYCRRVPDLLLTSSLLPDETGWLVAAKFRLQYRDAEVWLYSPWLPPHNGAFAEFVGVGRCIYYGGDLWQLSDCMQRLLKRSPLCVEQRSDVPLQPR